MMIPFVFVALSLPPGTLVDRVAAVVDKEVITYGELVREARVALVMQEDARVAAEDLNSEFLDSFLNYLVNQVIIAEHARQVGEIEISGEEVDRAVELFQSRFSSSTAYRAFLRRFDISDSGLRDILRRDLRNERYIADRMRTWQLTGEKKDNQTQYRDALERWIKELRAGVELRLLSREGELELQ